jgi:hypothetical protein
MPVMRRGRMLKRWRYVGVYGPELMLCIGLARIGPTLQTWWAVWDREANRLREKTRHGKGGVRFARGRADVDDGKVQIALAFHEDPGIEVVTPDGAGYAWTRKQAGIRVRGHAYVAGAHKRVDALGMVDDSAGYHARETAWRWSTGVGTADDGRTIAWNVVTGIHDDPAASERTVWIDGDARHVGPVEFADDLSAVEFAEGEALRFKAEATRERHENLGLFRSDYVQPFGTFRGSVPGIEHLREGYGVMERHEVKW